MYGSYIFQISQNLKHNFCFISSNNYIVFNPPNPIYMNNLSCSRRCRLHLSNPWRCANRLTTVLPTTHTLVRLESWSGTTVTLSSSSLALTTVLPTTHTLVRLESWSGTTVTLSSSSLARSRSLGPPVHHNHLST